MNLKYLIFILFVILICLYYFENNFFNFSQETRLLIDRDEDIVEKLKNLLIVTMCEPTDFMLQRSIRYQNFKSKIFDVWYIFDVTSNYEIPNIFKPFFQKNVYTFRSSDYSVKYPDMMDLIRNCARIKTVKKGTEYKYLAYLSLAERVNELYQKKKFNTQYIWIVEQDSAVTGNLSKIMEFFDQFEADLVLKKIKKNAYIYTRNNSYWKFSQCLSDKAKDFLEGKAISVSKIFFSRFSIKFMDHLNVFINSGYHGNSELVYPTVATLNNLTTMDFPPNLIYRYSHAGTRFTKEEYYQLIDTEMFAHSFKE